MHRPLHTHRLFRRSIANCSVPKICVSMSDEEPQVGDEVAWNWGSSHIEGEVIEKTDKKLTKEIKGKPITKNGEKDNPAYFVKQTKKKGKCYGMLTMSFPSCC